MGTDQRPLTRILLERMHFQGHHGVLAAERRIGGPFRVDLALHVRAPRRYRDRLSDTLAYRLVFARVRSCMERRRFRTLEALADAIALALLGFPLVRRVTVRVTKLAPPLGGGASSAVEIRRRA